MYFCNLGVALNRRGLIREGGLLLAECKSIIQMFFGILIALPSLKDRC